MKEKIRLISILNKDKYNTYTFEKSFLFFDLIGDVLGKVFDAGINFKLQFNKKTGKYVRKNNTLKKYTDTFERFHGGLDEEIIIDIFYGSKVILLIIICEEKLRLKFNKELDKISYMHEPRV